MFVDLEDSFFLIRARVLPTKYVEEVCSSPSTQQGGDFCNVLRISALRGKWCQKRTRPEELTHSYAKTLFELSSAWPP